MGCGTSSTSPSSPRAENKQRKVTNLSPFNSPRSEKKDSPEYLSSLQSYIFEQILKDCFLISIPMKIMPSLCLGENAFPLVTYDLEESDSTLSEVQLPIISASLVGDGKVIVYSQANFFEKLNFTTNDTAKFAENLFHWIFKRKKANEMTLYAIDFPEQILETLKDAFDLLELEVNGGPMLRNISNYTVLFLPSTYEFEDDKEIEKFYNYVHDGGTLVVLYVHKEIKVLDMEINKLLEKFNLAFSYLCLNDVLKPPVQVQSIFSYVKGSNFVFLINAYKTILSEEEIDPLSLDNIVANLRCYIIVCNNNEHQQTLLKLYNLSWDYLKRTNYCKDNLLCSEPTQGLVTVLATQIMARLSPEFIKEQPDAEMFPGKAGDNIKLHDYTESFYLDTELLIDTGLWLPPGEIGTIEFPQTDTPPDVSIRIGSHQDILYSKPQPWKRWPTISSIYQIAEKETQVATAFGGIVYISLNDEDKVSNFTVNFKNFCKFPIYDYNDDGKWPETKKNNVPWGELITETVIFTLPVTKIKQLISDKIIDTVINKIDFIAHTMSSFMDSYEMLASYRFVFDVEMFKDMYTGYPITLPLDQIDNILYDFKKPTQAIFEFIYALALVTIKDGFDLELAQSISLIAAMHVMNQVFPNETDYKIIFTNYLSEEQKMSSVLNTLFDIQLEFE